MEAPQLKWDSVNFGDSTGDMELKLGQEDGKFELRQECSNGMTVIHTTPCIIELSKMVYKIIEAVTLAMELPLFLVDMK
jgi:hypothetical protein